MPEKMPEDGTPRERSRRQQIAVQFVERFCGGDVDGLEPLLAAGLKFRGPFHTFESRAAYLAVLRHDPPVPSGFRLLSVSEGDEEVAVFYTYQKETGPLTIAQLFRFQDALIAETLLVFDGRGPT